MSTKYPGGFITKNPVAPSLAAASGIWSLDQAEQNIKANTWPLASTTLSRSLRFRASASAYLSRTPASASNQQINTFSAWVKYSTGTADRNLISFGNTLTYQIGFLGGGTGLYCGSQVLGTSNPWFLGLNNLFRDPAAWYHIVIAIDTTQATDTNRVKIYINGVQQIIASGAVYPTLNYDTGANSATAHSIGRRENAVQYFDGYMSEFNWIDGQALTPSSFGAYDGTTGVWQPAHYNGTYGTNGFYLPFTDNSALTTSSNAGLGKDFSGNANYWVTNNISITAGATYDSMTDVPTLTSATAANFAVINPLNTVATLTNGNLTYSSPSTAPAPAYSAIGVTTGKWYYEYQLTATNCIVGVWGNGTLGMPTGAYPTYYWDIGASGAVALTVEKSSGTATGTVGNLAASDIYGIALDCDNTTIYFYKNNTLVQTITGMTFTGPLFFMCGSWSGGAAASGNATFGQRPFSYTPPSGFVALNTYNLPASTVPNGAAYMAATLYTGTGASLTVANTVGSTSFQPDLVWIQSRSAATDNKLTDVVRGVTKGLISNTTGAETTDTTGLTAFGSTGFTVGANTTYNNSGATYVAWQWKAGGTAVSNTNGSITSSVSANTTSGFSVVTYTGTGVAGTIGHGLGVAPSMIIVKSRSAVGAWPVYHTSLGNGSNVFLNTTAISTASATIWNATSPTSSVFSVGINTDSNTVTVTYVAYCFAAIKGFSAFGSYTGNGSTDGPFVYTGFKPRYLIIKKTSSAVASWPIYDSSRNTYNLTNLFLYSDFLDPENIGTGNVYDFLSNGFKAKNSGGETNSNTATYIYMAFAENPFQNALAR